MVEVCSCGYAEELKRLGTKQVSYWYWVKEVLPDKRRFNCCIVDGENVAKTFYKEEDYHWRLLNGNKSFKESCSAFDVGELGQMLPETIMFKKEYCSLVITKFLLNNTMMFVIAYEGKKGRFHVKSETEANARAKMLIHLLENKFIGVDNV